MVFKTLDTEECISNIPYSFSMYFSSSYVCQEIDAFYIVVIFF